MKIIFILILLSCNTSFAQIVLEKYAGNWNVVYTIHQTFTKNCLKQKAEYSFKDNVFKIKNICIKKNGESNITGIAKSVSANNTKLEILFDPWYFKFFGIKGDYNILKIDPDYTIVLVGSSDKSSLWIMVRDNFSNDQLLNEFYDYALNLGYSKDLIFKL